MVFLHATPREHLEKLRRQAARLVLRDGNERDSLDDVFQTAWRLVDVCRSNPSTPARVLSEIEVLLDDPRFQAIRSVANAQKHGARSNRSERRRPSYVEVTRSSKAVTGGPLGGSPLGANALGALRVNLVLVTSDDARYDARDLAAFVCAAWERIFVLFDDGPPDVEQPS